MKSVRYNIRMPNSVLTYDKIAVVVSEQKTDLVFNTFCTGDIGKVRSEIMAQIRVSIKKTSN